MTFSIPLLSSAQSSLLRALYTRDRYSLSRCSVHMEYNSSYSALPLPAALCGYQCNTPLLSGWARCMGTVGDLTWIICLLTTHPLCQFPFHAPLWTHVIPCGKDCYHNSAVFIYATDEHITNFPITSCMYNMQMTEVLSPIFVPYL